MTRAHCDVVVVGAGVAGLTTAVRLLEAGFTVRVRTRDLPADTTSAAAGAYWSPYLVGPRDRVAAWSTRSYNTFAGLAADPSTGVRMGTCVRFARVALPRPWWAPLLPAVRQCGPRDLPAGYNSGLSFEIPIIDMPRYLEHLSNRIADLGGVILAEPVTALVDALEHATYAVNCTGLAAAALCADPTILPVRGQLVVVTNPGLSQVSILDEGSEQADATYIIPHTAVVVLGGTVERGAASSTPDPETSTNILTRCTAIEPRLRQVKVLGHTVGFRPTRPEVRIGPDPDIGDGRLFHNYGHGGAGVTVSWGCADDITDHIVSTAR